MFAAIEMHNKPLMPYRYQVCVLLVINAWELALKGYIYKNLKKVKLFDKNNYSKPFSECVSLVRSEVGKEFWPAYENITKLYFYRNRVAHFHSEELDVLVYSLLRANIMFFCDFLRQHLSKDMAAADNLVILPLGFSKSLGPVDFLFHKRAEKSSSQEVQEFVDGIVNSCQFLHESGIEDSILAEYAVHLVNTKRAKNADIIAKIDKSNPDAAQVQVVDVLENIRVSTEPDAKPVRFADEDEIFKTVYTFTTAEVIEQAKARFSTFKQDEHFNELRREWKQNESLYRERFLNPKTHAGAKRGFYSEKIFSEMSKHYELTEQEQI